jgi:hypothetical protein
MGDYNIVQYVPLAEPYHVGNQVRHLGGAQWVLCHTQPCLSPKEQAG